MTVSTRRVSLKTRITLFAVLIFVASLWALQTFVSQTLRKDMTRLMGEQQYSTASILAGEVNQQIQLRLDALERVAATITPAQWAQPALLQAHLLQRPEVMDLFSGGLFVTGPDATAVASVPASVQRTGINYADRDYVATALQDDKASLGKAVVGRAILGPTFSFGSPVRDAQGKVVGALAGVIDLNRPNFLDGLVGNRYGKSGGYFVVDPRHRMIVTGSDKRRIMEVLPAPGISPWIDRFIEGYEGSAVTVNPLGVEVLVSVKRLVAVDWYVSVILPTAEAFAPFEEMEDHLFVATLALTLLAALLMWWMLAQQLAPLDAAARTIAQHAGKATPLAPFKVRRDDEIGQLLHAFNRLLASLEAQGHNLQLSEARFRGLSEMSSDFLWESDAEHRVTFHSVKDNAGPSGASKWVDGLLGKRRWEVASVSPDEAGWQSHRALLDAHLPFREFEVGRALADGSVRTTVTSGDPMFLADGSFAGYYGVGKDVTERKAAETQIKSLAFFDPLTGLPNRRLLDDRLGQALVTSQRTSSFGALMFIDLDNFKPLNDQYGHAVGDLLLVQVATRLKACVRNVDTVARFGGDEFVVLLSALDSHEAESALQARAVAEKIRLSLAESFVLATESSAAPSGKSGTMSYQCTASLGVVVFKGTGDTVADVLKRADAAMYEAKRAGKNLIRFHEKF